MTPVSPATSQVTVTVYWQRPGDPTRSQQTMIAQVKGATTN